MTLSPIADGIMAATHKLVQQALSGQWQSMPKTVEERRVLLEQLSAGASPQDQQWLRALRQAIAESDAAVAEISQAGAAAPVPPLAAQPAVEQAAASSATGSASSVDGMIEMIRGSR